MYACGALRGSVFYDSKENTWCTAKYTIPVVCVLLQTSEEMCTWSWVCLIFRYPYYRNFGLFVGTMYNCVCSLPNSHGNKITMFRAQQGGLRYIVVHYIFVNSKLGISYSKIFTMVTYFLRWTLLKFFSSFPDEQSQQKVRQLDRITAQWLIHQMKLRARYCGNFEFIIFLWEF